MFGINGTDALITIAHGNNLSVPHFKVPSRSLIQPKPRGRTRSSHLCAVGRKLA